MKTLDKEVQIAIINEAGSTYRNHLLGWAKQSSDNKACILAAEAAAQHFIDLCTKNTESGSFKITNGSITTSKISMSNLSAVSNKFSTVTLYQWALTQPEVPEFCVFNWDSSSVVRGSKMRGWTSNIPATAVSGESLFELKVTISACGDEVFSAVPFKDYKIQVIAYTGK